MEIRHNWDEFAAGTRRLQRIMRPETLGDLAKGIIIEFFQNVLDETPQWSGDLTASWRLQLGGQGEMWPPQLAQPKPRPPQHEKGDPEAIETAQEANSWINEFQLLPGMSVGLYNAHEYAELAEENPEVAWGTFLRGCNAPGHMVARASAQIPRGDLFYRWTRLRYQGRRL